MHKKAPRGYIALMATIVISLVLLVMVVQEGFSGWFARFVVLGAEAKEQASSLAEGCADQALAALVTSLSYPGGVTTTIPVAGGEGSCYIAPIELNTPSSGQVTIKTQAVVRGSFANLATVQNLNSIHVGAVAAAPTTGTLIIQTLVSNPATGPQKTPSDFTMHAEAVGVSKTFAGSATGVVIKNVSPGSYSITEDLIPGYGQTTIGECDGTISGGQIKSCTISNSPVTTTLTVVVNVSNSNNTGTKQPGDIPLFIDGHAAVLGTAYTVTPGSHTVSATYSVTEYAASSWGYQCPGSGTLTMNTGDNKICVLNLADYPPPAPVCADTVMMLDRTGSMFHWPFINANSQEIADEKAAAKALVQLYNAITPHPKISIGRFSDNGKQSADIVSHLSTDFTNLPTVIDNALVNISTFFSPAYTNLADAISFADQELNSSYHDLNKKKVLLLLSDGVPTLPSSNTINSATPFLSPASSTPNAATDFWTNPTGAYADAGSDANSMVTGKREQYLNFAFPVIPADATVRGVEVRANTWATDAAASATLMSDSFGTGSTDTDVPNWSENGSNSGTEVLAPSTGDNAVSPDTGRFALIEGSGGWICRQIDASNTTSLALKYYWRGDVDAVDSDTGTVEYRSGGSCSSSSGWNTLATHKLDAGNTNTSAWSALQNISLPATLNNNSSFFIRFKSNSSNTNRSFRIDGVSVSGMQAPPLSCQLAADLSWDAGAHWSSEGSGNSEKTQTVSGTEATYTLGGSTDDWGSHTWVQNDFTDANFRVRVRANDPGSSCSNTATLHLDHIEARVHYSQTTGPEQAATVAATAAKSGTGAGKASDNLPTKIYAIHFGDSAGQPLLRSLASPSTLPTVTITSATRASNVVTVTTALPHNLAVNQEVTVNGAGALSGTFVVTATTTTTFKYAMSGGSLTVSSGTVTPTNLFIAPNSSQMTSIFRSIGTQECLLGSAPASAAAPTDAKLIVITHVVNNNNGLKTLADFPVTVTGASPAPASFAALETPGKTVTLGPGTYSVSQPAVSGYTQSKSNSCSSSASSALVAGETRVCILTNDDTPPPPPPPDLTITPGEWQEVP